MNISKNNIIGEKDFKNKVEAIFKLVADAVSNTLGPYGKNTVIEQFGEMHVTKDGWTVLKGITFEDNIDNNILYLLTKIASQVVVKVGDGSTSSIIAADEILKQFKESKIIDVDFSPREFTEAMNRVIIKLVEAIEAKSIKVNTEDFNEERDRKIYNLAMISTNGNKVISNMISEIYAKTANPSISFIKGSYANHEVEVINGYKTDIRLLDGIYVTNQSGHREEAMPQILMFDHRVDIEYYTEIIMPVRQACMARGRLLYVVAPYYSEEALQRIKNDTNMFFKATQGRFQDVYCRASIINNLSRQLYSDLACLLGATIIDTTKVGELFKAMQDGEDVTAKIMECVGTCETLSINLKDALFSGFINNDAKLYEVLMADAVSRYNDAKERFARMDIVSPELVDIKTRIAKLKCNMGIIKVGGVSTLEQSANYDLVDDAVKACESAFTYGYNIGCSLIIPLTVNELLEDTSFNDKEIQILKMLQDAFLNVYRRVIMNKYRDAAVNNETQVNDKIEEIINGSIDNQLPFDLTTNTYSSKIINPTHTDIEILKAAGSMVSLITTSNQYLKIQLPNR